MQVSIGADGTYRETLTAIVNWGHQPIRRWRTD